MSFTTEHRTEPLEDGAKPAGGVDAKTFRKCVRTLLGPALATVYMSADAEPTYDATAPAEASASTPASASPLSG